MMKRKSIFCLVDTIEINSDSDDTSATSNISELSTFSTENNWTDEEDALFFPLIKYLLTSKVRRGKVENYLAIVESWTDSEFKEHLRLSKRTAYQLIGKKNTFIIKYSIIQSFI